MARIKKTATRAQALRNYQESSPRKFIRVRWQSRTAAVGYHERVKDIVHDACKHFGLSGTYVLLGELERGTGEKLEITDGTLELVPKSDSLFLDKVPCDDISQKGLLPDITLHIAHGGICKDPFSIRISPSRTGNYLRDLIAARIGRDPENVRVCTHEGSRLSYDWTLADHEMESGDEIQVWHEQVGGKPVIYLFPPKSLPNASVSVTLVPQWTFTHIYSLSDVKALGDGRQRISWNVFASPDGKLVEKSTGLQISCLFWEAVTDSTIPPSPPSIPTRGRRLVETFHPAYASLEPDLPTAVFLPFPAVLAYIDNALTALTLHTAARTEFITHWLPTLSRHPFIALRFLPQAAHERAAELAVSPKPDVVTRVFMLFRGVSAEDAILWNQATERADKVDWVKVVGVKRGAWDVARFRVLEWGAMEVC